MSYQKELHECDANQTNIYVSRHPDHNWWLDKTIGIKLHIKINYCPYCGEKLKIV